jgi:hypothetical protein
MGQKALGDVVYGASLPVCILADSEKALSRMRESASAAGCRVACSATIDSSSLFESVPAAAALIELEGVLGDQAALPLLDWAQREAASGARRVVISAPAALLDLVAARTPHLHVTQLCEAGEAERVAAIALASQMSRQRFHDARREEAPAILQQLTEDVGRIAALLSSLSEDEAVALAGARTGARTEEGAPIEAPAVRAIIRARRMRDQFFRGEIFADPAWDMLLDLMAARIEGKRVAVSSLCIAAAVPATTALRWIKMLTDRGLFVRSADPQDGRRVYIELSDEAARALTAYLRAVERLGVSVI